MQNEHVIFAAIAGVFTFGAPAPAADAPPRQVLAVQAADGRITAGGQTFASWTAYARSDYFRDHGLRCGSAPLGNAAEPALERGGSAADCSLNNTNPSGVYDPVVVKYRIPVVVHVIRNSSGTSGNISAAMVQSQIDILNEDFLALAGSNGGAGTDVQIEFYLATVDPSGNPTTGITYTNNTSWYNDSGSYWTSLAWNTNKYLNIYTNTAGGYLGYTYLPQDGFVGSTSDRVVILWESFGRNAPMGPPYDQGRTTTHEVGHYLGLWHTFDNGCGTVAGCYTTGDRICDTNRESTEHYDCSPSNTCSSADPIHNYMNYTDDLCMTEFTPEQAKRMRCSLEHYRPNLYEIVVSATCNDGLLNQGETRIDCGGPCAACACTSDGACSDALFCTGNETCDAFGDCVAGAAPCGGATWCSEATDACLGYGDGDFDNDNDVDLRDFRAFQDCYGEFGVGGCAAGKLTGSGAIGEADLAAFTALLGGGGPQ